MNNPNYGFYDMYVIDDETGDVYPILSTDVEAQIAYDEGSDISEYSSDDER